LSFLDHKNTQNQTSDSKHLDSDMVKKKNAWGVQKSNKKGMAPYQNDEQKQQL
jgi:hypothetical protein